jgi:predicted nuclease of predicted toxin-antitoxin system
VKLFALLYLDENVDVLVAAMLRARGFDVVTTHDRRMASRSDLDQLALAAAEGRAMVTHNRDDFVELHKHYLANGTSHMGIIVTGPRRPREIAERIAHLLDTLTADEIAGQLFYV